MRFLDREDIAAGTLPGEFGHIRCHYRRAVAAEFVRMARSVDADHETESTIASCLHPRDGILNDHGPLGFHS